MMELGGLLLAVNVIPGSARQSKAEGLEKKQRDTHLGALLLMSSLIVMMGLTIICLPRWMGAIPSMDASEKGRAAHVQEKTNAEIKLRFEQGVAMLNAKEYEHALTAFHRVLQLAPNLPEAHVNAGFALIGLKRYDIARDFFEGAIELRKDQLNAYYGLAEALEGLNDIPGALGAMRTYVHRAPPGDPFRQHAEAAVLELEARMTEERNKHSPPKKPETAQH